MKEILRIWVVFFLILALSCKCALSAKLLWQEQNTGFSEFIATQNLNHTFMGGSTTRIASHLFRDDSGNFGQEQLTLSVEEGISAVHFLSTGLGGVVPFPAVLFVDASHVKACVVPAANFTSAAMVCTPNLEQAYGSILSSIVHPQGNLYVAQQGPGIVNLYDVPLSSLFSGSALSTLTPLVVPTLDSTGGMDYLGLYLFLISKGSINAQIVTVDLSAQPFALSGDPILIDSRDIISTYGASRYTGDFVGLKLVNQYKSYAIEANGYIIKMASPTAFLVQDVVEVSESGLQGATWVDQMQGFYAVDSDSLLIPVDGNALASGRSLAFIRDRVHPRGISVSPLDPHNVAISGVSFLSIVRVDCPAGSYADPTSPTGQCVTCPVGWVAAIGDTACRRCPKGTKSGLGRAPCEPCPRGFYSNQPEQSTCPLRCNTDTECPFAGTVALTPLLPLKASKTSSVPEILVDELKKARTLLIAFGAVCGSLILLLVIVVLVLFFSPQQKSLLKKMEFLDIFSARQTKYGEVEEGNQQPQVSGGPLALAQIALRKKTKKRSWRGGVFTVACFFLVVFCVAYSIQQFVLENAIVKRSLSPGVPESFPKARFSFKTTFFNFLGSCALSTLDIELVGSDGQLINLTPQSVAFDSTQMTCSVSHSLNLDMSTGGSTITVFFTDEFASSNAVSWEVTTQYLDQQMSSAQGALVPDPDRVFRSQSAVPSATIVLTPSQIVENSKVTDQGFLAHCNQQAASTLSQSDPVRAFSRYAQNPNTGTGFSFEVVLDTSYMDVFLEKRQTFMNFLAQIIALFGGAIAIFYFVLTQIERFSRKRREAKSRNLVQGFASVTVSSPPPPPRPTSPAIAVLDTQDNETTTTSHALPPVPPGVSALPLSVLRERTISTETQDGMDDDETPPGTVTDRG